MRRRVYAERWESETGYADLKTYLRGRQQILRSKNPDGVAQELYALLIVYQLVQLARGLTSRRGHDLAVELNAQPWTVLTHRRLSDHPGPHTPATTINPY